MFEYQGNVHIHSTYSDGSATIEEICTAAKKAGLDFIIVTDHYTLKGLPEEGYRNGLLLLVGMEINDIHSHYLALDIDTVVENNTDHPQQVIDAVNRLGGIGIIAHPLEYLASFLENDMLYTWQDWSVNGFQGIEIWNLLSQWKGSVTNFWKAIYYVINPQAALFGPYPEVMQRFDRYQQQGKKIVAWGGSDAHAPEIKLGPWKINIIPYEFSFRSINMHVLLPRKLSRDLVVDKQLVYNALRQGRCWVANDYYKSSRGFSFELCAGPKKWLMGDSVPGQENMQIKVNTPYKARVKLIKNGVLAGTSEGSKHVFRQIKPGVYRVEAALSHSRRFSPWIYSNSIWVN